MIIYRDLISHDEMFSDIYKIREIADGLCLEVEGKMVSRTEGNIDDSLIGGNASAEGPEGEGTKSTVITGVDIVMNHHLQETSFTKEAYKKYIKDYMKSIKGKLEEQRPERVKPFMTGAAEQIKHILANFKNYQFFIGENMNPDGMVALLDYREDGVTPYMIFFKDGLEMENVNKFGSYFGSIICHHNWLLLVIHTTPGLKTNGTDVILSTFILTVIYLEWRHCFLKKHVM